MEDVRRRQFSKSDKRRNLPLGDEDRRSTIHTKRKRRKRRRERDDDEPFHVLFIKVGICLSAIFWLTWQIYRWCVPYEPVSEYNDDQQVNEALEADSSESNPQSANSEQKLEPQEETILSNEYIPRPLPVFNLSDSSEFDVFALSEMLLDHRRRSQDQNLERFWNAADGLRRDYAESFGDKHTARTLLDLGLSSFGINGTSTFPGKDLSKVPPDIRHTACRILTSRQENRPFRVTFGGYSVTAGRGNYFHQSFPFVMEKKLHTVFLLLGVHLEVKNAAIGGVPAFPYGWCFPNFWGNDSDVISWDFSMNEAQRDTSTGLEAYIRHAFQLPRRPKLIVKDTHAADARRRVLRYYHDKGVLQDPVVLHSDSAAQPFLSSRDDRDLPSGFRDWRKFGAPKGAPGQQLHHPAVKEHEFDGWLLCMHFLAALEVVAASLVENGGIQQLECSDDAPFLPDPLNLFQNTSDAQKWQSAFWGIKNEKEKADEPRWTMRPTHCLTSFEPIVQGDLVNSAVTGAVSSDMDVMLPKSKMFFNAGWVLDLSQSEKKAKQKLGLFGGLGFVDSKKAFYGILMSGQINFLLPHKPQTSHALAEPKAGDNARKFFHSVIVCEVNEKLDATSCNMQTDLGFEIGGVNATASSTVIDAAGTLYLGKKLCVYIPVPQEARLTIPTLIRARDNRTVTKDVVFPDLDKDSEKQVGLQVGVRVRNRNIVQRPQACSISHLIWQQPLP